MKKEDLQVLGAMLGIMALGGVVLTLTRYFENQNRPIDRDTKPVVYKYVHALDGNNYVDVTFPW